MIRIDSTDFESIKFTYIGNSPSGETTASLIDKETGLVIYKNVYNFEPGNWQFWFGIAPILYKNLKETTFKFEGGVNQSFDVEFLGKTVPFTLKGEKFLPFTNGDIAFQTFIEVKVEEIYHRDPVKVLPGDIVLDIGANYGFFSLYAAERGASQVIAVEPYEPTFACMETNLLSFNNVVCENVAIAQKEGTMPLTFSTASGCNYLSKNGALACSEHSLMGEILVKTVTINQLIEKYNLQRIDFLKVDCEGGELDLFETITDENLSKVEKIVIEYHSLEIYEFLTSKIWNSGFTLHEVTGSKDIGLIYAYKNKNEEFK